MPCPTTEFYFFLLKWQAVHENIFILESKYLRWQQENYKSYYQMTHIEKDRFRKYSYIKRHLLNKQHFTEIKE